MPNFPVQTSNAPCINVPANYAYCNTVQVSAMQTQRRITEPETTQCNVPGDRSKAILIPSLPTAGPYTGNL